MTSPSPRPDSSLDLRITDAETDLWFPHIEAPRYQKSARTGFRSKLQSFGRQNRYTIVVATFFVAVVLILILPFTNSSNITIPTYSNSTLCVDLGYSSYVGQSFVPGVNQWLGIRYAASPLKDLRFRAPAPPVVDNSVHLADNFGPICLQTPSTSIIAGQDEDCLFLNVFAPSNVTGLHPVHVLFNGGGLNSNADAHTNGTSLIIAGDYDIVVVTFTYRVGPWGFLASKEVQGDGDLNVGLLDQRAVLHWVQDHISSFGGDPNHVTIGGASAGGASVDLHLTAYGGRDDGLFHAAAAESQSFGAQLTVEESQYQYDDLVERVGCATAKDTLVCLRNVDAKKVAQDNLIDLPTPGGAGGPPNYSFSNVIDGTFTPDYTYQLFTEGKFVKVPVIFGDVTNEGTVFVEKNINNVTEMNKYLRNNFVKLTAIQLATIDTLYPKAEQFPGAGEYWRSTANAYGEMRYNCPGIYLSGQFPKYGIENSWNYHWDVLRPSDEISGYGVKHTAEFAAIWGTASPPDAALIPYMQGYWSSFIRVKDPNKYRYPGSPVWETFTAGNRQRIYFPNNVDGVTMETVPDNLSLRCAYLTSIGALIAQ